MLPGKRKSVLERGRLKKELPYIQEIVHLRLFKSNVDLILLIYNRKYLTDRLKHCTYMTQPTTRQIRQHVLFKLSSFYFFTAFFNLRWTPKKHKWVSSKMGKKYPRIVFQTWSVAASDILVACTQFNEHANRVLFRSFLAPRSSKWKNKWITINKQIKE